MVREGGEGWGRGQGESFPANLQDMREEEEEGGGVTVPGYHPSLLPSKSIRGYFGARDRVIGR